MSGGAAAAPLPPSVPISGSLYASGSSGDGGDDPSRRRLPLDPSHSVDANPVLPGEEEEEEKGEKLEQEGVEAVPGAEQVSPPAGRRRRWGELAPAGPQQCATCFKVFPSIMSLHGHMRCHPARLRRWGAALVANDQEADRKRLFICDRCGQVFLTRQSLGGHRASHKGQQGCYEMAKEEREYGQPSSRKARKNRAIKSADQAAAEAALSDANSVLSSLFTEQARPPTAAPPRPLPVAPTATGPSTETRQGRRRKKRKKNLLSLDLNLIPVNINLSPEISSSEEMDNIGGNTSSSSTSS